METVVATVVSWILFICPPSPTPAPGGITIGETCGPTTITPENRPHSEQGAGEK